MPPTLRSVTRSSPSASLRSSRPGKGAKGGKTGRHLPAVIESVEKPEPGKGRANLPVIAPHQNFAYGDPGKELPEKMNKARFALTISGLLEDEGEAALPPTTNAITDRYITQPTVSAPLKKAAAAARTTTVELAPVQAPAPLPRLRLYGAAEPTPVADSPVPTRRRSAIDDGAWYLINGILALVVCAALIAIANPAIGFNTMRRNLTADRDSNFTHLRDYDSGVIKEVQGLRTRIDGIQNWAKEVHGLRNRIDVFQTWAKKVDSKLDGADVDRLSWNKLMRSGDLTDLKKQIEALELVTLDKWTAVNHFAPAEGARIDPYRTSPTGKRFTTFFERWFTQSEEHVPNLPPVALEHWDDVGDCWCAAGVKAQLGIRTSRRIFPTRLAVEYIPDTATLDNGSAPRQMELWVKIDDLESLPTVHAEVEKVLGSSPPAGDTAGMDESWVRIASFEHTPSAVPPRHSSAFAISVDLEGLGVDVQGFAVRAYTNWGSKLGTCFYRVTMEGKVSPRSSRTTTVVYH